MDRSNFEKMIEEESAVCYFCKIDENAYRLLTSLQDNNALGETLQHSLSYPPFDFIFSDLSVNILQQRLDVMLTCFENCIKEYGYDDVVIPNLSLLPFD